MIQLKTCQSLRNNFFLQIFFISLVCLNGVIIGVQADYDDGATMWHGVDLCFIVIFLVEVSLKIIGFGGWFWSEPWNVAGLFESILVLSDDLCLPL